MSRRLYLALLRLHPPEFRRRFGREMLWIFDESARKRSALSLLADASVSLARQWARRPRLGKELGAAGEARPALDGVPAFFTFRPATPGLSALMNGGALSLVMFGAVSLAFFYGRTHQPPARTLLPGWAATHSPAFAMPSLGAPASWPSSQPRPNPPPMPATLPVGGSLEALMAAESEALRPAPVEPPLPPSSPPFRMRTFFPIHVSERLLRSYSGTYVAGSRRDLQVQVILEDGTLHISFAGREKTTLVAITQTQFCPPGISSDWVEFQRDEQGRVTGLTFHRGGQEIRAWRLEP